MTSKISKISLYALTMSAALAFAQTPATDSQQMDSDEQNETSLGMFPDVTQLSGSELEKQRDEYLREKKLRLGFSAGGTYHGWATATIEASPKSLDFGQKRIMAFEKALTDAKGKFVQAKQAQVSVQVAREFFHLDLPEQEIGDPESKAKVIKKKFAALVEAKLDQGLRELGVDPDKIAKSDIEEKRKLAADSLEKETVTRSVQSVAGIRVLATFEDLKGVGVVIKQKRDYADLARAIASRKLLPIPSEEDPISNIAEKLDAKYPEDSMYFTTYGVRILSDSNGNRVLTSFGQWSPKITRTDSSMKINMAMKAAREIAHSQALSYLTQFLNTTIALDNAVKLKDSNEINEIVRSSGAQEQHESSSVGASINQFIKENSTATIEGVSQVKSWTINHPETGHPIVGTVLMWSPVTQEYARQKPKASNKNSKGSKKQKEVKSVIRKSVDFGDEDF